MPPLQSQLAHARLYTFSDTKSSRGGGKETRGGTPCAASLHFLPRDGFEDAIVDSLQADAAGAEAARKGRIGGLQQRLAALRARMDQMYEDKLDGKIEEEFWARKMNEWREQESVLQSDLSSVTARVSGESSLTVKRIFELANRAFSVFYPQCRRTGSIAEIGAFELRDGRSTGHPHIQKAVRPVISASKI